MNKIYARLSAMRKTAALIFLILICISNFSAFAAEIEPVGTPLRKLQRGFLNIALSPIEISTEWHNARKTDNFFPSWISGFGRGAAFAAGRMLTGLYEILTFPIPVPAHYEPVVYPEFAWEHLDKAKA